jgi:hypothetical protein
MTEAAQKIKLGVRLGTDIWSVWSDLVFSNIWDIWYLILSGQIQYLESLQFILGYLQILYKSMKKNL